MQKQVVEFAGEAVGALVPEQGKLRFLAVKYNVWPLDGRLFSSLCEATQAIATHMSVATRLAA